MTSQQRINIQIEQSHSVLVWIETAFLPGLARPRHVRNCLLRERQPEHWPPRSCVVDGRQLRSEGQAIRNELRSYSFR